MSNLDAGAESNLNSGREPKTSTLPRGRQPAAYDEAALRSYLQAQWDAHRRLPTYAQLQHGDPEQPDVPRFGGSLTRLVRLRRAFLAEVDPTSVAASQHRLSRVEKAVDKNTDRTEHAIDLIEGNELGEAVRDLQSLADSLRLQINTRDVRTQTLQAELSGLRKELQPLLRAFSQWDQPAATASASTQVAVARSAKSSGDARAKDSDTLEELLASLKAGQTKLVESVGGVATSQAQLGQAIAEVRKVASERHHALDVVADRLEAAVDAAQTQIKTATEEQARLSLVTDRLDAAAHEFLSIRQETTGAVSNAAADKARTAVESRASVEVAEQTKLLATVDGRLESIERAFAAALAASSDANDQVASVAREVAAAACVELGTAANALRALPRRASVDGLAERLAQIEKGVGTLLGRRPPKGIRLHDDSLGAIEEAVEKRCVRIVRRLAALGRKPAQVKTPAVRSRPMTSTKTGASGRVRKLKPSAKGRPRIKGQTKESRRASRRITT